MNNKTAHIIYVNYLTPCGDKMSIGGIQTYITNLSVLLIKLGYKVSIYQKSSIPFHKVYEDKEIYGVVTDKVIGGKIGKDLFKICSNRINRLTDILIFGCDNYICNTKGIPFIAIQHGITWDKPENKNRTYWMIKKFYRGWCTINRIEKANIIVCVDNNFINWYRSMVNKPAVKLVNIPNFAKVCPLVEKPNDGILRIIFARRFWNYRGTRIFVKAVLRLIGEFDNIEITIAGEGPDEKWMKETLSECKNVRFITYASGDSLKIHENKNIAVVPTLGSEGTSLSLLEAMSTQCAVICTNVGGMTDIIIDHYNGLMINPDEDSLFLAMKELISDSQLRKKISTNAYESLKSAFSLTKWNKSWENILSEFEQQNL